MQNQGTLIVRPVAGKLTRDTDVFSKMDPYVVVKLGQQKLRTKVHRSGGKFPSWQDALTIQVGFEDIINIEVWDQDSASADDLIGSASIPLAAIKQQGQVAEWYNLTYKGRNAGQVRIEMQWFGNQSNRPNQQNSQQPQPQQPQQPQTIIIQQPVGYPPQMMPGQYPPGQYPPGQYPPGQYPPQPYPQTAYPPQQPYPPQYQPNVAQQYMTPYVQQAAQYPGQYPPDPYQQQQYPGTYQYPPNQQGYYQQYPPQY